MGNAIKAAMSVGFPEPRRENRRALARGDIWICWWNYFTGHQNAGTGSEVSLRPA
jgi:hypothetical protein